MTFPPHSREGKRQRQKQRQFSLYPTHVIPCYDLTLLAHYSLLFTIIYYHSPLFTILTFITIIHYYSSLFTIIIFIHYHNLTERTAVLWTPFGNGLILDKNFPHLSTTKWLKFKCALTSQRFFLAQDPLIAIYIGWILFLNLKRFND